VTGRWAGITGTVLATVESTNRTGPTLVFIGTILVVMALLGTVAWRASRTTRQVEPRDAPSDTAIGETRPNEGSGRDEEAAADDA
jgi:hypothetical protein